MRVLGEEDDIPVVVAHGCAVRVIAAVKIPKEQTGKTAVVPQNRVVVERRETVFVVQRRTRSREALRGAHPGEGTVDGLGVASVGARERRSVDGRVCFLLW